MTGLLAPMEDWNGTRVGVLGLGRSGLGAVRLLRRHGAAVVAFDDRSADALPTPTQEALRAADVEARAGRDDVAAALTGLDALVVSPGVPGTHPLVVEAERRGLPTLGELELACRRTTASVVAVTGTNGKSTTVSLVHAMIVAAGRPSVLAGNIGVAISDEIPRVPAGGWVVVEASSFQLERIEYFHPRVAAVLNLAPDHLDRYPSFEAYGEAKRNILRNLGAGDSYVFPVGEEPLQGWAAHTPARHAGFSTSRHDAAVAWIEDGAFVRRSAAGVEPVLPLAEWPLLGAHNRANALAAIAIGSACGLSVEAMATAMRGFQPLAHRAVPVASGDGVRWIDDSKATNVHAASATLAGLDDPVIALLGGSGKGEDYRPLRAFAPRLRAAICYGEQGPAIADALAGTTRIERVAGMLDALALAADIAVAGDVVLLSPACASFDEFRNFEHRGEVFADWVRSHRGGDR